MWHRCNVHVQQAKLASTARWDMFLTFAAAVEDLAAAEDGLELLDFMSPADGGLPPPCYQSGTCASCESSSVSTSSMLHAAATGAQAALSLSPARRPLCMMKYYLATTRHRALIMYRSRGVQVALVGPLTRTLHSQHEKLSSKCDVIRKLHSVVGVCMFNTP